MAKVLSITQFSNRFDTETAAVAFVERAIWRGTPVCPFCGSVHSTPRPHRHGHRCRDCRHDFTVRHGTIFANSRLPMRKWLWAIYLTQVSRKGVSSIQLAKQLDVTQKTAWFMQQRLREAADPAGLDDLLEGDVEIDELYVGGRESRKRRSKRVPGTQGRSTRTKTPVVGLRERHSGRTRLFPVTEVNRATVQRLIESNVLRGSRIHTDEAPIYTALPGYGHVTVNHSRDEWTSPEGGSTNGIESVWAVFRRGLYGTYHHVTRKHLQRYVNEFAFRLNEGCVENPMLQRISHLCRAAQGRYISYKDLIAPLAV